MYETSKNFYKFNRNAAQIQGQNLKTYIDFRLRLKSFYVLVRVDTRLMIVGFRYCRDCFGDLGRFQTGFLLRESGVTGRRTTKV